MQVHYFSQFHDHLKCGIIYTRFHAFNYGFYVVEEKTSKLNILPFFFSLLSRGSIVGFFTHSNEVRVSGKSGI